MVSAHQGDERPLVAGAQRREQLCVGAGVHCGQPRPPVCGAPVMAQVEIQAGPHRFVCLLSREAADELGLEPGMLAVAAVKATNVSVEIPHSS